MLKQVITYHTDAKLGSSDWLKFLVHCPAPKANDKGKEIDARKLVRFSKSLTLSPNHKIR